MISIDELASYCKRRGFVYPSGEIYGGLSGFYDFGPLGVEMKNRIKQNWWNEFVKNEENIVGLDGSIITNPKVWEVSGHTENFTDPIITCTKCNKEYRADHVIEDVLKISTDGLDVKALNKLIRENKIKCSNCKKEFSNTKVFNLMFETSVGAESENKAYLRPETAQLIFANFKNVYENSRLKLPCGIAQIGKAYRNEIRPRNFLFRVREFEHMELEFFINPNKKNDCPRLQEVEDLEISVYTQEMQEKKLKHKKMSIKECVKKGVMKNKWQAYWNARMCKWYLSLGINPKKLRLRQHLKKELSHYAEDTWDVEYQFSFGWKEIAGNANRGQFDLKQHEQFSKKKMSVMDDDKKVMPYVASEPSLGVERAFLTLIVDAYTQEKERIVLKLSPKIAPVQIAVFPLVNKEELPEKSRQIFELLKNEFQTFYDASGSIGRRYRRQDEIGTPYCVTIDYETMEDNTVTIRDRDSMKQWRENVNELITVLKPRLK
ncbi:MAG: glycine--tRNA ligase [Nanoarchaeota archaeon]|nr:glycine--tRNA ligase [Nanoarchaeota archaeon]